MGFNGGNGDALPHAAMDLISDDGRGDIAAFASERHSPTSPERELFRAILEHWERDLELGRSLTRQTNYRTRQVYEQACADLDSPYFEQICENAGPPFDDASAVRRAWARHTVYRQWR